MPERRRHHRRWHRPHPHDRVVLFGGHRSTLADGTILRPWTQRERLEFVDTMLSPVLTTGYGLGVFEVQGFIGHDGAIDGFSTAMFHLPETDATIVVVGNHSTNFTTPSVDAFIRHRPAPVPGRFPPA